MLFPEGLILALRTERSGTRPDSDGVKEDYPYGECSVLRRLTTADEAAAFVLPGLYLGLHITNGSPSGERVEWLKKEMVDRDLGSPAALGEFELIADTGGEDASGIRGGLVVLTDNLDPERDVEFNRWYDTVHVPEIMEVGTYRRARRYRLGNVTPGPRFLAIYETDWDDPVAAHRPMQENLPKMHLWDAVKSYQNGDYGPGERGSRIPDGG